VQQFSGLVRYEYRMTVQRWGMWFAFGVLYALYGITLFAPGEPLIARGGSLWQTAGQIVFRTNLFMPLVGGIIAADRLYRDYRLGVRELQSSAPLGDWTYLVAKYIGVVAGIMTPVVVFILAAGVISVVGYGAPVEFLPMLLAAMLALSLPAFAFVTIFSLACPLVMPVRVYQVLFTGYWFWGNFLSPKVIPNLSDTLLTPGGMWAFQGFFGGFVGVPASQLHTATEAVLNLVVLAACIVAAFVALRQLMAWHARRV
jgi:hypothetical protein